MIRMKKWNDPKFSVLNVSGTKTNAECSCSAQYGLLTASNNTHFCHRLGEWHENGCKKTEGHYRNDKCSVHWNIAHDSKCCCAEHPSDPGNRVS